MSVLAFPARTGRPAAPQPCGLTDDDCFSIAAASRRLPGRWLAQRDEDASGRASMVLISETTPGAGQAVLVRRVEDRLQVVLGRGSGLVSLGSCRHAEEAVGLAGEAMARDMAATGEGQVGNG